MKVALAHDFLIKWGGAEKVLFDLHKIFPKAPIYTLFYNKKFTDEYFQGVEIKSSYLQKRYHLLTLRQSSGQGGVGGIRGIKGRGKMDGMHRWLLPWMPLATESMDFSDYDLVVSSSSAFLKGIIVPTKTKHICYVHTPTRWAWQDRPLAVLLKNADINVEQTLSVNQRGYQRRSAIKKILMAVSGISFMNLIKRLYVHLYRLWDFDAAQRPDMLMANSKYTARRIEKYYKRKAEVVYPGVEIFNKFPISNDQCHSEVVSSDRRIPAYNTNHEILPSAGRGQDDKTKKLYQMPFEKYFVVVSRLSAYKKIDLIIEAFKDLPFNLVVVGDGKEIKNLKFKVKSLGLEDRVFFTGFIKDKAIIAKLIKNSIALIHLTEEDFGISMAEALALGTPVIGLEKGGAKEIIKKRHNGELIGGKNNKEIIGNLKNAVKKLALNEKKYIINIGKEDNGIFSGEKFTKAIVNLAKTTINT